MKMNLGKWAMVCICGISLGLVSNPQVQASHRAHRTSIIKIRKPHQRIGHKQTRVHHKYAQIRFSHIHKMKRYGYHYHHYHYVTRHRRVPMIHHITRQRIKALSRYKIYHFKYRYSVVTAEPVDEYSSLNSLPMKTVSSDELLRVRGAIYHRDKVTPFGFELTNGNYIPSYAVAYQE